MSRRKPVPDLLVASLKDADKVLEELSELDRRANAIKSFMNEAIDKAKSEAADQMAIVESRKKVLEAALTSYAVLNKSSLFNDKRSLELDFGILSFRRSTKIVTAKRGITWDKVLERIKELGQIEAIRAKEEVNKDTLANWDDERLESIGAKRKTEDTFGYTLKQQEPGVTQAA